jgi:hypothetical protein
MRTILKKPAILNVAKLCNALGCTRKQYSDQHRRISEDMARLADKSITTGKKVIGRRAGELVMLAIQNDYLAHNALKEE